ncbi:NAD-dependent epimerase/dehydratase family protein [Chryseobacterium sp. MYb264]|uniref:NAD-dependent epimerase/dehydratase family protein n=1 Tax=Chryseobacterium sp. MYb264 TaxID=2745153 RepID=UPI002E0E9FCB|nr:NAD-dependent epimerase/dehydratase family protein [Chryseobacterium sp. MYb264]
MIIGNGVLARALQQIDDDSLLLFASGVSNSLETREEEFTRELTLLQATIRKYPEKKLVYFSTSSVHDSSKQTTPYVLHKLNMENFILKNHPNFVIFRVGNAIGSGGNPNTLLNFLSNQIKMNKQFPLYSKARRPLIDVDDIAGIVQRYRDQFHNEITNISYPYQYSLKEIISAIEKQLNLTAIYEEVPKGDSYHITFTRDIEHYFKEKEPGEYLQHIVSKYIRT